MSIAKAFLPTGRASGCPTKTKPRAKRTRLFYAHSSVRKRKEGGLGQKTNTKNCPEIALQGERRSLARLCIPVRRLRYAVGGRKNSRRFGYVKRIASLKSV